MRLDLPRGFGLRFDVPLDIAADLAFGRGVDLCLPFEARPALEFAYSGSFALPVSRFHSSKVSFEISPFIKSSANFRRCAWLLNGILAPVAMLAKPIRRWHCRRK